MTPKEFDIFWENSLLPELLPLEGMRKKEKRAIIITFVAVFFFLGLILFLNSKGLLTVQLVLLVIIATFITHHALEGRGYYKQYKTRIIPILLKHTKYQWDFSQPVHNELKEDFKASGLYSKYFSSFFRGDAFKMKKDEMNAAMTELTVQSGTGKNRTTVFKGLFIVIDMPKPFLGETYIQEEMDKTLSLGMAFRADVTNLEWNDFEKKLHVETTDQIGAREIFSPDFMVDIFEWWQIHNKFVRLSFKGNHVYIAIPFGKDMFGARPFSTIEEHKKDLWEYLDAFTLVEHMLEKIEQKYGLNLGIPE